MNEKALNKKAFYVHLVIILFFFLGFGLLPEFSVVTRMGMQVLGVFIGCIFAWACGYTTWVSVLGLIMLGLYTGQGVTAIMGGAYGSQTILLVLFCLLFCYGIEQCGLLSVIAKRILSNNFCKGGPWCLAGAFWGAATVTSALITNALPVVLLLWSIFYAVSEQLGLERYSPYSSIVLIGITSNAYCGMICMPYSTAGMMVFGIGAGVSPNLVFQPVPHSVFLSIMAALVLATHIIFFKFVVRPQAGFQKISSEIVRKEDTVIGKKQVFGIFFAGLLCLLLLIQALGPKTWVITQLLLAIGPVGIFALVNILMCVTIFAGAPLMRLEKAMAEGIPWGLYFLLATAVILSNMVVAEGTGLSEALSLTLNPLLNGKSLMLIAMIAVAFGVAVTNAINNMVCINIFVPICTLLIVSQGGDPAVLLSLLTCVLFVGIVMPSGSVVGALCHGNSEWLKKKDVYKYAGMCAAIVAAVYALIGVPLGGVIYGLFV
ncbi:MAG: hypothetical protein LBK56_10905 [Gracilibacteraceae bacterium]|nr:hypothetical protein [Gracilibacteraceae bacterium]